MQRVFKKMNRQIQKTFSEFLNRLALIVKLLLTLFFVFFVVLFLIVKPAINPERTEDNMSVELTKEEFIEEISPIAQKMANTHGIRPSVLVAQAALESNWGNSRLARESHNYFGIKNPKGKKYATKEYGDSGWTEINASFKQYSSLYESVLDYANLIKNGTSWDKDFYQKVIDAPTYKEAAHAVSEAGYATDPYYAEKLIKIIEQYDLHELDKD